MKLVFVISLAVIIHQGSTILYGRHIQVERLPYVIPCTMVWKYNKTEYKPGSWRYTSGFKHNFSGLVIARNLILTQGQFFAVGTMEENMHDILYEVPPPRCWPLRSVFAEGDFNFEIDKIHIPEAVIHHEENLVAILQVKYYNHVTFGSDFHMAPLPLQDIPKNAYPRKGKIVYAAGFGVLERDDDDYDGYNKLDVKFLGVQRFQVETTYSKGTRLFSIGPLRGERAMTTYGDQGGPVFTPEEGLIGMILNICPPLKMGVCSHPKYQPMIILAPFRNWIDHIRLQFGKFDDIGDTN